MSKQLVEEEILTQEFIVGPETRQKSLYKNKIFNAKTLTFQEPSDDDIIIEDDIENTSFKSDKKLNGVNSVHGNVSNKEDIYESYVTEEANSNDFNLEAKSAYPSQYQNGDGIKNLNTSVQFNPLFNKNVMNAEEVIELSDDEEVFTFDGESNEDVFQFNGNYEENTSTHEDWAVYNNTTKETAEVHSPVNKTQLHVSSDKSVFSETVDLDDHNMQIDFMNRSLSNKEEVIESLMQALDEEEKQSRRLEQQIEELKQRNKELVLHSENQEIDLKEYGKALLEKDKEIHSLEEVLKSERKLKKMLNHSQNELRKTSLEEREELVQKIQVMERKISELKKQLRKDKIQNYKGSISRPVLETCCGNNDPVMNNPETVDESSKATNIELAKSDLGDFTKQELIEAVIKLVMECDSQKSELRKSKDENIIYIDELRKEIIKLKEDFAEVENENRILEIEISNLNNNIRESNKSTEDNKLSTNIKNVSQNVQTLITKLDNSSKLKKGMINVDPHEINTDVVDGTKSKSAEEMLDRKRSKERDIESNIVRKQNLSEPSATQMCDQMEKAKTTDDSSATENAIDLSIRSQLSNSGFSPRTSYLLQLEQEQNIELNEKLKEALRLYDEMFDQVESLKTQTEKFQEENLQLKSDLQAFVLAIECIESSKNQHDVDLKDKLLVVQENQVKFLSDIQHCERCKLLTSQVRDSLFHLDHLLQKTCGIYDGEEDSAATETSQNLKTISRRKPTESIDVNKNIKAESKNTAQKQSSQVKQTKQVLSNNFSDMTHTQPDAIVLKATGTKTDPVPNKISLKKKSLKWKAEADDFFCSDDYSNIIDELEQKYILHLQTNQPQDKSKYSKTISTVRQMPKDDCFRFGCYIFVALMLYSIYLIGIFVSAIQVPLLLFLASVVIALVLSDRKELENLLLQAINDLEFLGIEKQEIEKNSDRHGEFSELYSIIEKQEDVLEKQNAALSAYEKQLKREKKKRKKYEQANNKRSEEELIIEKEQIKSDKTSLIREDDITLKENLQEYLLQNQYIVFTLSLLYVTIILTYIYTNASAALTLPAVLMALLLAFILYNYNETTLLDTSMEDKDSFAISFAITIVILLVLSVTAESNSFLMLIFKVTLSLCSGIASFFCLKLHTYKMVLEEKLCYEWMRSEELNTCLKETKEELYFKTTMSTLKESTEVLNNVPVLKRDDIDSISVLIDQLDEEKKKNKETHQELKSTTEDIIRAISLLKVLDEKFKAVAEEALLCKKGNSTLKKELLNEQVKTIVLEESFKIKTKENQNIDQIDNTVNTIQKVKPSSSGLETDEFKISNTTHVGKKAFCEDNPACKGDEERELLTYDVVMNDSANRHNYESHKSNFTEMSSYSDSADTDGQYSDVFTPEFSNGNGQNGDVATKTETENVIKEEDYTASKSTQHFSFKEINCIDGCSETKEEMDGTYSLDLELQNQLEEEAVVENEFEAMLSKVIDVQQSVNNEVKDLQIYYERDQQEKLLLQQQVVQLSSRMTSMKHSLEAERQLQCISSMEVTNTIDHTELNQGDDKEMNANQLDAVSSNKKYQSLINCYIGNIEELEGRLQNEKRIRKKLIKDYEKELDILEKVLIRKYKDMDAYIKKIDQCFKEGNFEKFEQLKFTAANVMDDKENRDTADVEKETLDKKDLTEQSVLPSLDCQQLEIEKEKQFDIPYIISRSSEGYGRCEDINCEKIVPVSTKNENNSWIAIEYEAPILAKSYKLRHGWKNGNNSLRHWVIEGSNDKHTWTLLDVHVNDCSLDGRYSAHTWDLEDNMVQFKIYRLRMTSLNSSGTKELYINAFEIYGV
ncbi:uncharacterized protein LOC130628996 isoform X2 [Hydractinia symbiolongicarpus]|uniref:uncharacterized protein LOC130628996 isoform X2 n=1 Tax=Hydractinia symbiolongicarpus TaxID=13093 RepID=UPI00254DE905|nr:uncharacterized protein LOC130628996 isoform X2 [Hydractinia symbiolongicarpus]